MPSSKTYRDWLIDEARERRDNVKWKKFSLFDATKRNIGGIDPLLFNRGVVVDRCEGDIFVLATDEQTWPDHTVNFNSLAQTGPCG